MSLSGNVVVFKLAIAMAAAVVSFPASAIDEWDAAVVKDNTASTTKNELQRGTWQYHDLEAIGGVADEDWFVMPVTASRAYQIAVSEGTGDTPIANADFLELYDATGTTLIATAGAGTTSRVIRFYSNAPSYRIRVKGNANSPATARYGIAFFESSMYCPRWNNTGSQISVLIVQNVTNSPCTVDVNFQDDTGVYLKTVNGTANGLGLFIVNTSTVPELVGKRGNANLAAASCSSSALKAKLVALEPSTGFSFDTLCERR